MSLKVDSSLRPRERGVEWISHAMAAAGVSQAELSRRSGMSRAAISRLLNHKRNIRISTLFLLIEACGFEVAELRVRKPVNTKATPGLYSATA